MSSFHDIFSDVVVKTIQQAYTCISKRDAAIYGWSCCSYYWMGLCHCFYVR